MHCVSVVVGNYGRDAAGRNDSCVVLDAGESLSVKQDVTSSTLTTATPKKNKAPAVIPSVF